MVDPSEKVNEFDIAHAYDYPAVSAECPLLWIPQDPYGFSKALIADVAGVIDISDKNATIDKDSKFSFQDMPPSYEDIKSENANDATDPKDDCEITSQEIDPFADPNYKGEENRPTV